MVKHESGDMSWKVKLVMLSSFGLISPLEHHSWQTEVTICVSGRDVAGNGVAWEQGANSDQNRGVRRRATGKRVHQSQHPVLLCCFLASGGALPFLFPTLWKSF